MNMVRNLRFRTLTYAFTIVLLLSSIPVYAQLSTGVILGVVKDTSGGVVPDATITIQSVETNQTRTVTTDNDGAFHVPALPVGNYTLKIEKAGFKTQTQQGLVLNVSQELVANATLEIGTSAQEVTVTGEAPLVNTTNSSLGGLVNEQKITELPLNGRSFLDLSLLQPGVIQVRGVTGTSGTVGGNIKFSSNGAPMRSNNAVLDGAIINSMYGVTAPSASTTTLGVDGIREYKVVMSNFSAEYGLNMGSQLTMISKGGTNQFHGDAFEYLRNGAMDGRNYFDVSYLRSGKRVPQYQRNNFGGAFGGPIKKDKLFFFGVYEGLREKKGLTNLLNELAPGCHGAAGAVITNTVCPQLTTTASVTIAPQMAPIVALFQLPNVAGTNNYSFTYVQPTQDDYGQMRVDYNISRKDTFFTRYTIEQSLVTTHTGFPQHTDIPSTRNQFITISETHIFSPTVLNTGRLSYSRTNNGIDKDSALIGAAYSFAPGQIMGALSIPGLSSLTPNTNAPIRTKGNVFTLSDDVYYSKGKHALQFGMLLNRFNPGLTLSTYKVGVATFPNIANFFAGNLQNFLIQSPVSLQNKFWRWYTYGFYVQDDWRATSRLTVNLGLRWETNTPPLELNGRGYSLRQPLTDTAPTPGYEIDNFSKRNFSPRIGFAWDVTGHGKTSVRAGFGVYYDIAQFGSGLGQQTSSMPPIAGALSVNAPTGGTLPLTFPMVIPPSASLNLNFQEFDYYSKQPYLEQWNLSINQELPANTALSVAYVGTRGIHLFTQQDGNPCTPNLIDSRGPLWSTPCGLGRQNTHFGYINWLTTTSDSWYEGLQASLQSRVTHGLQFQLSYTWAKNTDTGQGQVNIDNQGNRVYGPNTAYDKGPTVFDTTQNMRLNVLYHIPNVHSENFLAKFAKGWWMGSVISAQTGYPFSLQTSGSRSQSLVQNTRPDRVDLGSTYDPNKVILGTVQHWFDPTMFALQPVGRLGNSGRDILRGPHLVNVDFSVNKDTKLKFLGEAGMLQFRAEFFNLMNHPNFGLPNNTVFAGALANITEAPLATAGQITTLNTDMRDVQVALKVIF